MIKSSILLATIAVPALLLGGCMGTENRGMESVHQPVVSRSDYVLDLGITGSALARGEPQRLAGWMTTMKLGYGDRVAIDDPQAEAGIAREQVAGVVASFGLLLSDDTPVTQAPVTPGSIRVVVTRMHASVPGCPDWSRNASHDFNQNTSSNFGCATNVNLASMVARPEDLVRGATGTGMSDAAVSYKAIDTYRKAVPSGAGGALKVESTGGSK